MNIIIALRKEVSGAKGFPGANQVMAPLLSDYTQYTYFSVTGIFLVTDTLWSHAVRIKEILLYLRWLRSACKTVINIHLHLAFCQGVQGSVWGEGDLVWTPSDWRHGGPGPQERGRVCVGMQELWWRRTVRLRCTRWEWALWGEGKIFWTKCRCLLHDTYFAGRISGKLRNSDLMYMYVSHAQLFILRNVVCHILEHCMISCDSETVADWSWQWYFEIEIWERGPLWIGCLGALSVEQFSCKWVGGWWSYQ